MTDSNDNSMIEDLHAGDGDNGPHHHDIPEANTGGSQSNMVAAHDSEPEATHGTTSAFTTPETQQQDNARNNDHTMNLDQQAQTNMMIQQLTNIMQTMMTI